MKTYLLFLLLAFTPAIFSGFDVEDKPNVEIHYFNGGDSIGE